MRGTDGTMTDVEAKVLDPVDTAGDGDTVMVVGSVLDVVLQGIPRTSTPENLDIELFHTKH